MFKVTLDPQEKWVGVTVESEKDAAHFCKAAAEIVCGVHSYDKVDPKVREVYEAYAREMSEKLTALWDRTLWDYRFDVCTAPDITVTVTFGVAILTKLGII